MDSLLAVDLGFKTGLALYRQDGKLVWYRSKNFGSPGRLKRGAASILREHQNISLLVLEGGGTIADIWEKEAGRKHIPSMKINAERWRKKLLYPREQKSGPIAKHHADDLARKIIRWSNAPGPTALRHDTAEAILIGFWAVLEKGWLTELPHELKR